MAGLYHRTAIVAPQTLSGSLSDWSRCLYTNATSCDGPRMLHLLFVLLAPIAPKSGATMCALAPADFQAAGVANADKPKANINDGGASVYCTYAGKSAATGGIELDVFYPAGGNANEAKN